MRFWVVDDEPELVETLCSSLEFLGHENVFGIAAGSLLEIDLSGTDVVLLDLNMPGRDGLQVLTDLAGKNKFPRVLMMSGLDSRLLHSAQEFARSSGFKSSAWIQKPVSMESLRQTIAQLIDPRESEPAKPRAFTAPPKPPCNAAQAPLEQFVPFFQPKIALGSGELYGFEALIRWQATPDMLLAPGMFLDDLRTSGRMGEITRHMVTRGLDHLRTWNAEFGKISCAFNYEASLLESGLADLILEDCHARGLTPDVVTIELTESELLSNRSLALAALTRMRVRGFALSMDDFGTGYSSLSRLASYPFTEIKLDVGFVSRIGSDANTEEIIRESIDLAHKLGMKVCAEGVEHLDQLSWLMRAGCDLAQGYLIARPMPAKEAGAFINAMRNRDLGALLPGMPPSESSNPGVQATYPA